MPTWKDIPEPFRVLARWITIAQAAGFGVGLAFARQRLDRFRGMEATAAAEELLLSAHSHLLGMTALFAISGMCFALCPKPDGKLKTLLLAAPLGAVMLAFTAVWLMKYAPVFIWLLLVANLVMSVVFYWQIIVTLRELKRVARSAKSA